MQDCSKYLAGLGNDSVGIPQASLQHLPLLHGLSTGAQSHIDLEHCAYDTHKANEGTRDSGDVISR